MNLFSTHGTLLLLLLQLSANASQSKWPEKNDDEKIMNLEEKHLKDLKKFFHRKDSEKSPKKNKKFNTVKVTFPQKKNNQTSNLTRKKTNR